MKARAKRLGAWMLGGAAIIGAAVAAVRRYSYARPDSPLGLSRDPSKLVPSFAARLEVVFAAMRARDFDPVLHEAYRTPERARELAKDPDGPGPKKPVGSAKSLHSYGAAVDIISRSRKWNHPAFFTALGEETKRAGLYWGGDFGDRPHVQAIPYDNATQDAYRALAPADRDAFVRRYIDRKHVG